MAIKYLLNLKSLLLLFAVATSACFGASQDSQNKAPEGFVTVCEVLANRVAYNGKVVALLGHWSSTEEGFWMMGDCGTTLKTGDYTWSNIISLAYDSSSPSRFPNGPKFDRLAADKRITELISANKVTDKLDWAVVYGRIETKEELSTGGFGNLGAAPAQIVYRKNDLIILPRK